MSTIKGRVSAGGRGIRGVLIEAFDVPGDFQDSLPLSRRGDLGRHKLRRLGSAITEGSGEFSIPPENGDEQSNWYRSRSPINLWVLASACCADGEDLHIIYQAGDVRACASSLEYYPICLPADYSDASNESNDSLTQATPDGVIASHAAQKALSQAQLSISKEEFSKRIAIRKTFAADIAPKIRRNLSLVEVDAEGEPLDPDYVKPGEAVRAKAEQRMRLVMAKRFAVNAESKLALAGRVSLTPAQVQALDADPASETITVGEDDLLAALQSGAGENPENGQQIVSRVNAIQLFCREKSGAERCLSQDDNDENGHGDDEVVPIERDQPSDGDTRTGDNITVETLKEQLPRYIANVLDGMTSAGAGSDREQLSRPGSQLSENDLSSGADFPSLRLPPGPADVPAFHDFYDLQIAFKPVWAEALDEGLIGDIENVYERYVENGGDPQAFLGTESGAHESVLGNLQANLVFNTSDPHVQKHIDITNEEWTALSNDHQKLLQVIALKMDHNMALLEKDKLQGNVFTDGLTAGDLATFNHTKEYVLAKNNELREQGERLVRVARAELERQASGKSLVPGSRILSQLVSRANSAYPAKYFAADKRQRSINFGLLINYRQKWTPTAYQVGELIKSIPLAPKEIRKFSKKIVKREKRARKEIESNLESQRRESSSTVRAEADIVQKAMEKTNFNASANGSFTIGVWSGGGSSGLSQDTESQSQETKKSFHEAVMKAAQEYKNEHRVELETESSYESEFQETGEISNPNEEITVTYLFYELQRRYRVEERLHRLTSVVLVAQEMPKPQDIDEDWLIAHRWILNRVMLDDLFKQPLAYVAEGQVAEEFALEELRKSVAQQRRLVEELKEDVADSRVLTESRYASLQRSMERTARATQRKSKSGGVLGFARKLTSMTVVGDIVDRFIGGESETPEAARVREAAAQDAYQREVQRVRDLEGQLAQTNASLSRATEDYADRLAAHLANLTLVAELRNHVKDNITHYMQACWMHEPFQQRWLRLKDEPVPVLKRKRRKYIIDRAPMIGALANVAHRGTHAYNYTTTADVDLPPEREEALLETVPLYQVADIDGLLGFRANYMIFPMKEANAITDFMMEPFVEKAAGGFGIVDPDDLGNMSLDEFSDYVCCLKEHLSQEEFAGLRDELLAQLKKLLQSPLRENEEIVVPMDATYIEALTGARPILENFKLFHRQVDAADALEDLNLKKMEKIRYAQRLLNNEMDDPETDARYVFEGAPGVSVGTNPGGEGGGTPPPPPPPP